MPIRNPKLPKLSEAQEQIIIFNWARFIPELRWLFAIPNGGSRHVLEAVNLKRQGVKKGISDLALLSPKGRYHGLLLELKVGKNIPTKEQTEFLLKQNLLGYCGVICYGHEEAIEVIKKYLNSSDLSECIRGIKKWAIKYGMKSEWENLEKCI